MATRREITQAIVDLLPEDQQIPVDQAIVEWYRNIRAQGGYRLTQHGYKVLEELGISSWSVPIEAKQITKIALMDLDRKLHYPYYIDSRKKKLVMFSSREAMMATLYGNVTAWLNNLR